MSVALESSSPAKKRPKAKRRTSQEHKARKGLFRLIFVFAIFACAITYYTVQIITTGYQITEMENNLNDMQQDLKDLQGQVATLNSLENIEYLATTELKMIYPSNEDVVKIKVSEEPITTSEVATE